MRHVDYVATPDEVDYGRNTIGDGPHPVHLAGREDLNCFADGFAWGPDDVLGGLQTAQAILCDALQNDALARVWTVEFWRYCIRNQPAHGFRFTRAEVIQWVIDALTAELTGENFPEMKEGTDG